MSVSCSPLNRVFSTHVLVGRFSHVTILSCTGGWDLWSLGGWLFICLRICFYRQVE